MGETFIIVNVIACVIVIAYFITMLVIQAKALKQLKAISKFMALDEHFRAYNETQLLFSKDFQWEIVDGRYCLVFKGKRKKNYLIETEFKTSYVSKGNLFPVVFKNKGYPEEARVSAPIDGVYEFLSPKKDVSFNSGDIVIKEVHDKAPKLVRQKSEVAEEISEITEDDFGNALFEQDFKWEEREGKFYLVSLGEGTRIIINDCGENTSVEKWAPIPVRITSGSFYSVRPKAPISGFCECLLDNGSGDKTIKYNESIISITPKD